MQSRSDLCKCGHGLDACAHSGCGSMAPMARALERFAYECRHDYKTIAERKWTAPKLAPKPQQPCDHGLFSDEANQLDLVEMLQDPTNGE